LIIIVKILDYYCTYLIYLPVRTCANGLRHFCDLYCRYQTAIWPAGKGLGGSSLINYMQYLRGSRHDYDGWASGGAAGWAYRDVLPYFIKSEDQQNGEFVRTGY